MARGWTIENISCNLCGAQDADVIFRKGGLDIVRCRRCGLVYVNPRPAQSKIWERYSPTYFWDEYMPVHRAADGKFAAEWHRHRALPILKHLEPFRKTSLLLDVGCAAGFFLKVAQEEGWDAHGVEIMAPAVEYARSQLNLDVVAGTLEQARFNADSFDVVVMIETIEHLLDPVSALRETYRVLRPGGAAWIATPNLNSMMFDLLGLDWSVLSPFEHLFYFTEATLSQMLGRVGFRTVDFFWHLDGQTFLETVNPFNTHRPNGFRGRLVKSGVFVLGPLVQPIVIRRKRTDRLAALAVK